MVTTCTSIVVLIVLQVLFGRAVYLRRLIVSPFAVPASAFPTPASLGPIESDSSVAVYVPSPGVQASPASQGLPSVSEPADLRGSKLLTESVCTGGVVMPSQTVFRALALL